MGEVGTAAAVTDFGGNPAGWWNRCCMLTHFTEEQNKRARGCEEPRARLPYLHTPKSLSGTWTRGQKITRGGSLGQGRNTNQMIGTDAGRMTVGEVPVSAMVVATPGVMPVSHCVGVIMDHVVEGLPALPIAVAVTPTRSGAVRGPSKST